MDGCIRYVSDAGGESAPSATSPSCSALWSGGGGVWVYGDLVVGTKAVGCEVAVVHPRVTAAVVGPRVGIDEIVCERWTRVEDNVELAAERWLAANYPPETTVLYDAYS